MTIRRLLPLTWALTSALLCASVVSISAQTTTLEPDWGAADRFVKQNARADALILSDRAMQRSDVRFTLPVLGLIPGFADANPSQALRDSFVTAGSKPPAAQWWPSCAKDLKQVPTPVSDATGTWYTLNYDYGCIFVRITGDRNTTYTVPPALVEELADFKGESSTSADEENDPDKTYMRTFNIKRFRVPYIVAIECNDASKDFCKNDEALKALVSRLSFVAGAPEQ